MRNLKILGLALLALFATSAALASTAAADDFTAEIYPATVTGSLDVNTQLVISTTAGNTSCSVAKGHGTIANPSTMLTITSTPTWEGCSGAFPTNTVDMNGCDFVYRILGGGLTTGTVDIVCPPGVEITKTASMAGTLKCTLHIPPQAGIGPVTYTNIGGPGPTRQITVDVNANNLKYSHTSGTGLGACAAGVAVNGVIRYKTVWTGELDGGGPHVGLFLTP